MVSPIAAGFSRGASDTLFKLMQLNRQENLQQQQLDIQKENLKLQQQQLKGLEATQSLNRAKIQADLQAQQQKNQQQQILQRARGQAGDALSLLQETPAQRGFDLDPQARGKLQGIVRQQLFSEGKGKQASELFETEGSTGTSQNLVKAVMQQPQFLKTLPAPTREAILPQLVLRGLTADQTQSPQVRQKQILDRQKSQFELDELARKKQGREFTPTEREAAALKLRAAIRQEPKFKVAQAITIALGNVEVGARRNDAAGDLAIVNGFAKILDPTSVIRPSEFTTVEQAQGFFERMGMVVEKFSTGQRLKPEVRQRFLQTARQIAQDKFDAAVEEIEPIYRPRAEAFGIPFREIFLQPKLSSKGRADVGLPPASGFTIKSIREKK